MVTAAEPTDEWFGKAFGKAWKDKADEIGRFNLAIFGKTGVGKSHAGQRDLRHRDRGHRDR